LQDFNGKEFLKCLKEYVKIEKDWIPQKIGYSLYLRPTAISMTVRFSV
jgi:branched-chain amino acid aminotransferase